MLAHARHSSAVDSAQLALTALRGLELLDAERGRLYSDMVLSQLNAAAQEALEAYMESEGYELQSEWAKGHYARGLEKGHAAGVQEGHVRGVAAGQVEAQRAALRNIFEARGLSLSDADRARIESCGDSDVLDRWIRVAATANSTRDVFAADD